MLDLIDAVADRLLIYKIKTPTEGCIAMAKIIVKAAEETDRAVHCLRTLSPFYHKHAVEVNRLENEADRLLRDQLAALFEGGTDADRGHQVEGAVRDDGVGHRPLRGRGQRHRGHHPQDGLRRTARPA